MKHSNLIKISIVFILLFCNLMVQGDNPELFKRYLVNMLNSKGVSFNVEYRKLELLATDTTIRHAKVDIYRDKGKLVYFRIIDVEGNTEMLYCDDSTWHVDNTEKTFYCLGNKEVVFKNGHVSFVPIEFLYADTSIFANAPYWQYVPNKGALKTIRFNVGEKPKEITNIKMEIVVDTTNLSLVQVNTETVFGEMGTMGQKLLLSDFTFYSKNKKELLRHYYPTYKIIRSPDALINDGLGNKNVVVEDKYIDFTSFVGLNGKKVVLPQDGYLFFDLWYVGCFPCMKAVPIIEKVSDLYKDKVHFYSLNEMDDDMKKVESFKERMKITIPLIISKKRKAISTSVSLGGYPLFILVEAKTGKVLWHMTGFSDDLETRIIEGIKPFIEINK